MLDNIVGHIRVSKAQTVETQPGGPVMAPDGLVNVSEGLYTRIVTYGPKLGNQTLERLSSREWTSVSLSKGVNVRCV